ncbi:hypothetical protein BD779DRAFT_1669784 [Infundibulicybe gibba]|nr:hypothetical protein BD779DRAFT_1669784 [Infundibulicybe gibba]
MDPNSVQIAELLRNFLAQAGYVQASVPNPADPQGRPTTSQAPVASSTNPQLDLLYGSQPPTASQPPPQAPHVPQAPPIQRYRSIRTGQGLPHAPGGFPSVIGPQPPTAQHHASHLNTSQANHNRLAAAAANLPRAPPLPPRGRRRVTGTRGPSVWPPSLAPVRTTIASCYTAAAGALSAGEPLLRVRVKEGPTSDRTLYYYRFDADIFNTVLNSLSLSHDYDLLPSTKITTLFQQVAKDMEESLHRYQFVDEGRERVIAGLVLPRKNLPFQLLEFVNQGRVRGSSSYVFLRRSPIPERTTIADIAAGERREFYCPPAGFAFEGSPARFVIHLVVRHYPITLSLFPSDDPNRRHTCISLKIYSRFRYDGCPANPDGNISDSSGGVTDTPGPSDLAGRGSDREDSGEEGLGEEGSGEEGLGEGGFSEGGLGEGSSGEHGRGASTRLNNTGQSARSQPQRSSAATVQNPLGWPSHARRTSQAQRQLPTGPSLHRPDTAPPHIPPEIWSGQWEPSDLELLGDEERLIPGHIEIGVFDAASAGSAPDERLSLRGANTIELAEHLCMLLTEAGAAGDFTRVLLPEREFLIVSRTPDGLEQIRSLGDGIEREVIYTAFHKYLQSPSQWFLPRAGDFSTVATCHSLATAIYLAPARRQGLLLLGALTGLFLIHGMAPAPLSPVLLHYFIHGCDLNAIHEGVLGSWYPELHHTIRSWLDAGAGGDTREFQTHFATFHDMQVKGIARVTPRVTFVTPYPYPRNPHPFAHRARGCGFQPRYWAVTRGLQEPQGTVANRGDTTANRGGAATTDGCSAGRSATAGPSTMPSHSVARID